MEFLLLGLSYIKDAAKAVKRIAIEAFIEVHDDTLTKLLGIRGLLVTMYAMGQGGRRANIASVVCSP